MAAPHRINSLCLLLIPSEDLSERELYMVGKMAGRVSLERGLHPVFIPIQYGVYLDKGDLEQGRQIDLSRWWLRRATHLWLCLPPMDQEPRLDRATYEVLMENDALGMVPRHWQSSPRLPVHRLSWDSADNYKLQTLPRKEVQALLRRNIGSGLLDQMLPSESNAEMDPDD